jgi:hypothetical protein
MRGSYKRIIIKLNNGVSTLTSPSRKSSKTRKRPLVSPNNGWKGKIKICFRFVLHRAWRRLHNEELNALYTSPNIIRVIKSRRMSWAGHVARMGAGRGAYRILVRRPEGRRPLGRPRLRWENNIKMDL